MLSIKARAELADLTASSNFAERELAAFCEFLSHFFSSASTRGEAIYRLNSFIERGGFPSTSLQTEQALIAAKPMAKDSRVIDSLFLFFSWDLRAQADELHPRNS